MHQVVISFVLTLLISSGKGQDPEVLAAAGAVPGIPPGYGAGFGGGLGGSLGAGLGGGFPGFGFQKNLDISGGAGFGPFLGGLGGIGGVPPPPVDGAVPDGPPLGLIGPSYIPSTWLGSALGAKGDLLFPIVLFVFFVVGVWTIIQFLLGLIVPLIAAKFAVLKGATDVDNKLWRRDVPVSPQEEKEAQINQLTNVVMAAIENVGCMKMMACQSGNFIHSIAGEKLKDYNGPMEAMKTMSPEMSEIFKKAALTGKEDCSVFACHSFAPDGDSVHGQQNADKQ